MSDCLRSFGLCKSAGFLLSGEDTVRTAARAGKVRLIVLANDAGTGAEKRARQISEAFGTRTLTGLFTKTELGHALGLESVAIVAVTNNGFAKMLTQKIEKEKNINTDPSM